MKLRILVSALLAVTFLVGLTQTHAYAFELELDPLSAATQASYEPFTSDLNRGIQTSISAVQSVAVEREEYRELRRYKPTPATVPATGNSAQTVAPANSAVASLDAFAGQVHNGQSSSVTGVYVPNVLALKVLQQPGNNPNYISVMRGTATQFGLAAQAGTIGLLAHNYSSGELFSGLVVGQEVDIIYGDGALRRYRISTVRHFQAVSPMDPYSNLVDLDGGNVQRSSSDVFNQVYGAGNAVVFQTCIKADGNSSWGRLFVTAAPVP
ncbi:MAG: hypothetical protein M1570_13885 [Chloroflexi bacterium]|nr:hypothetical protein [Chloroflexota bacterium]